MGWIVTEHFVLSILAVFNPQQEPQDPPSFCPRSLKGNEMLITWHLAPRTERTPATSYTRDNIKQGLHRMLLHEGRVTKLATEHLGEREFLIAEIIEAPLRNEMKLTRSRALAIEKYCAQVTGG